MIHEVTVSAIGDAAAVAGAVYDALNLLPYVGDLVGRLPRRRVTLFPKVAVPVFIVVLPGILALVIFNFLEFWNSQIFSPTLQERAMRARSARMNKLISPGPSQDGET